MVSKAFDPAMLCARAPTASLRWRLRLHGVDGNKSALGAATRRSTPVIGYTGLNGGGKSLCAVYDVLPVLAGQTWTCSNTGHLHMHAEGCTFNPTTQQGCICPLHGVEPTSEYDGPLPTGATTSGERVVWSTTRLLMRGADGRRVSHPRYRAITSLNLFNRVEHAEVLLDEVPGIADSRQHASMPAQIAKALFEMRRRDVSIRWTAVDFSAADSRLRQITRAVAWCGSTLRESSPGLVWSSGRLFRWATYDRTDFEVFNLHAREDVKPLAVQWFWRPDHPAADAYDTLAPVLALSVSGSSGSCLTCGGTTRKAVCGCPSDDVVEVLPGVVEVRDDKGGKRRLPADAAAAAGHVLPVSEGLLVSS